METIEIRDILALIELANRALKSRAEQLWLNMLIKRIEQIALIPNPDESDQRRGNLNRSPGENCA